MRKAIFLDRDGVINRAIVREGKPFPPATLSELEILPGVNKGLRILKSLGYLLIVVTNQPDVARGKTKKEVVESINILLANELPIDEFRTCYHDDSDQCNCRKPQPGAILAAAKQHQIDLDQSYMIGDRWRDVEAGVRAGCHSIFIDYAYAEKQPERVEQVVSSLFELAVIIQA